MTYDDTVGRDTLLTQERNLLHGQFAKVCSVRHDASPGSPMCPRGSSEDAFLGWCYVMPLSPNLTNDSRTDACLVRPLKQILDNQLREGSAVVFVNGGWINALPIPGCTHNDVNTRCF